MKKKMIVISNMYPTATHPTFGIFVKNQVEQLRSAGVDVEVIAISDPSKGKVALLKKYASWLMKTIWYFVKYRRQISLTHAHYAFPTGLLSLIGKRLWKIPYVVTVHGGDIDQMAKKSRRIASLTATILQQAEQVIVVGERLRAEVIERFQVPHDHVQVMSMGIDTAIFKSMPQQDVRQQLGIREDEKIILFVGNMIEAKGLLDLIEAVHLVQQQVPQAVLHTIGATRDVSFWQTYQQKQQQLRVSAIHHPPLSQEEVAKWMAAADVFVLPSHHEGFGLVALEAMATGTPVIGSNVGGLAYLLQDGAGILVEPKNPAELAQQLVQVLNGVVQINPQEVKNTVQFNDSDAIVKKLLSIYASIQKG